MKMNKLVVVLCAGSLFACSPAEEPKTSADCQKAVRQTVGVFKNDPKSFNGYTLFATGTSRKVHLIDNKGNNVHDWPVRPATAAVYLLENGHLLLNSLFLQPLTRFGHSGVTSIQELSWEGKKVWGYHVRQLPNKNLQFHHDAIKLPNGNILAIAWERFTKDEVIAQGRNPELIFPKEKPIFYSESLVEIKPDYEKGRGGEIVWEWHLNDHLVQNLDPTKNNYFGATGVHDHPERVNINYVPSGNWTGFNKSDWVHLNSVDYNPHTDQILLSSRELGEIWIIDHSTTTQEAAGHTGGKGGKGGDLLYRFGNPQSYDQGTPESQQLFYQHNAQWIRDGLPGAGNIILFNNRAGLPEFDRISSLLELKPDYNTYGKASIVWSYKNPVPGAFYSTIMSGTQRLPNGNTLSDLATVGRFVEVTTEGEVVWDYVSPETRKGPVHQGQEVVLMTTYDDNPFGVPGGVPGVLDNVTFRVSRYAPDYPGLQGKDLTPKGTVEKYPAVESCK